MLGQEVLDRGGDCSTSAGTKVEAVGRSVAGRIVKAGGDIFRMILIVFRGEE